MSNCPCCGFPECDHNHEDETMVVYLLKGFNLAFFTEEKAYDYLRKKYTTIEEDWPEVLEITVNYPFEEV